jgi:Zn-dependent protease with chaperone function
LRYDTDAVAGVIAHEVAHWRAGDAVTMAWGKGVALPLALVYGLAVRAEQAAQWGPARLLVRVVLWSVTATMRGLVVPVHARHWRACEYAADAAAAAAGYGDGLYRALASLRASFDGARSGWEASMLATHPPTELRLERLEAPGRGDPLPPGHGRIGGARLPGRRGPDKD